MTDDIFADRVAKVRQRFISTLTAKIDETSAALPQVSGEGPPAAAAVADAFRCMHGIVGIGPTVGFATIGGAAREVLELLRPPFNAKRGLTADETSNLKNSLQALRTVTARELQTLDSLQQ
jgi:chemotaxis protein histidine kinase CheA